MGCLKKIKVLIIDDSLVFRESLARGLSADPMIEVVGSAADPFEAKDKIPELKPDVLTCDVRMPKMSGIEFIRRLLPQYPLPVIVVSGISHAVFDALKAGAVDFVAKPAAGSPAAGERFIWDLTAKIKAARNARVGARGADPEARAPEGGAVNLKRLAAIGASTGGIEAIYSVLSCLPPAVPGIVIVQHIPPVFSKMFADRLNLQTALEVREAVNGDYVVPGKALIAPGDRHMSVRRIGDRYKVNVFAGDKVNGHCPSVDVLFESVAAEAKADAVGVLLTGMGRDGARGLLAMRRAGAGTIGQDEPSSVVYGMPKAAFDIGAVERQEPLSAIPQALLHMLK